MPAGAVSGRAVSVSARAVSGGSDGEWAPGRMATWLDPTPGESAGSKGAQRKGLAMRSPHQTHTANEPTRGNKENERSFP